MYSLRPCVLAFLTPIWVANFADSAAVPTSPAALATDRPPRPVSLLRSEASEGSRAARQNASNVSQNSSSSSPSAASARKNASNGAQNSSSSSPPAASAVGALLQLTGQTAEGSVRSRFLSVVDDVDEALDGAESQGRAGTSGWDYDGTLETITLTTTTTEFLEPTTQAPRSYAFVQVTPDAEQQDMQGVVVDNSMRCKGDYVFAFSGATTQWKCEALATVPPTGTHSLRQEDVRYYQFCHDCPPPRCQLVQWCLEVDTNPGAEWRLYRNAQVTPDMWYMAAGHTMCTLPDSFFVDTSSSGASASASPAGVKGVQHQLACQEYAAKENKQFYQFCSSCTAGEKCTIVDTCDRCISMDVTDWHVFKAERAGPPCSTTR